jgi:catalase
MIKNYLAMAARDKATNQLEEFKKSQQKTEVLTTSQGAPIGNKLAIQTVGPRGPALLQDFVFQDEMAHFNRERIPERVVHAKGAGRQAIGEIHQFNHYAMLLLQFF